MDIVTLIGIIWEDIFKVKKCLEELVSSGSISLDKEVLTYYFPVGDSDEWFKRRSPTAFPPPIGFVTTKDRPKTFIQYGLMKFTIAKVPRSEFRLAISSHLDEYEIKRAMEIGMKAEALGIIQKNKQTQDLCFKELNSTEELECFLTNYQYPRDYYSE